ncbi:hypothetical protein VHUM_02099 [Vanrija humicola]|uniref:Amidohydrolase 3 domain-containing protein n=1 Tax=Vanrija humicola TaxID=5417 RepID=A0A7D8V181_VANHU|nr:hypothetical protein VHUM_02099 [Vanrija humicola]
MTLTPDTPRRTLFLNAALVGKPAGRYSVLVDGGVIVNISTGAVVDVPEHTEVVDLARADGSQGWLSPGLIDWHTHFTMNTLATRRLDLSKARSAAAVLEAVAKHIDDPAYDEGGRFVARDLRNAEWPDADKLTRAALDAISATKPIVLVYNGYHSIQTNTPGLKLSGRDTDTDEHKDHSGFLVEADAFGFLVHLQDTADANVLDAWVIGEAERAASLGVTEVVDLEFAQSIESWERRTDKGFKSLRVHIGFYPHHLDDALKRGLKTGDAIPGTNDLVTAGPFKLITDGSLGSQTAFCCDHYPGNPDNRGILAFQGDEIDALCLRATTGGLRLAVHAIGDDALRLVLDKLEKHSAAGSHPLRGSTIEHAQLVHLDDLPRFHKLGLIASIQPRHLVDDRELCHKFWPGREPRAYAFKAIVDAGIPIKLGSDCPVAQLDPWEALACAITRAGPGEQPFVKEQIIDLETAYAASTHNGKLHIAEGERADLVVLGSNPLEQDAAGLRAMVVEGTLLGGNWTYRRGTKA